MIDYIYFQGHNGQTVTMNDDTYPMTLYDSQVETVTQEWPIPSDHGLYPTFTYMGKRTFHMEGDIFAANSSDFLLKRQMLLGPFVPVPGFGFRSVGTLTVKYTGMNESVYSECYLDGLPQVPLEALSPARGTYAIALQAFDPIMYGSTAMLVKTGLPGVSGGFAFPVTFPITFTLGQGGGGDTNITNSGNAAVFPIITIYGPCKSPAITLRALGQAFTLSLSGLELGTGEYVILDFKQRTVTSSTFGSAYSTLLPGSVWWSVPPGTSTVSFSAFSASSPAHAEISFSNGYMI